MPHIIIEYSANLHSRLDVSSLIDVLHEAALRTGIFPLGGTRTRAAVREHYKIADGHADNGFIHVTVKIGHGRDLQTRQSAGQALFDALSAYIGDWADTSPLALSLEMQEIDPVLTYKKNSIHEFVTRRQASGSEQ